MLSTRTEVFSGVVWDQNPKRQYRVPSPTESQQRVLTALLDTPLKSEHRNPLDWVVSLGIHAILLAAVLIAPLFFTNAIDMKNLELTYLVTPLVPSAPPPPPPAAAAIQKALAPRIVPFVPGRLVAPSAIPQRIVIAHDAEPAPDVSGGVIGGIPGGVAGGVLSGIIGGTGTGTVPALPPPPTTVSAKKDKEILRIGGDVRRPQQLFAPAPRYPPLARAARVQGIVLVEAVIDEHGNVVNVHVVQGPPLLIQEALTTVMRWKYEPTYLNGEPYPITMTVTVTFSMS